MNEKLQEMLRAWEDELAEKKAMLYKIGDQGTSLQYNLLATEALTLSVCISDVLHVLEESR